MFRVPQDHDGQAIACPSCRQILRIPTELDCSSQLIDSTPGEPAAGRMLAPANLRQRSYKFKGGESYAWEELPESLRLGSRDKVQLRLLLIGGVLLFVLIMAAVVISMRGGSPSIGGAQATVRSNKNPQPKLVPRSEASILAEAEPLTRKFLEATSVAELLPLIRNPKVTEGRLRVVYPDGKIAAPGLSKFNSSDELVTLGKIISFAVTTSDQQQKALALIHSPEGMKVDWESWVGWSDISWDAFISSRSVTGHVFRLLLSPVDYYNFGFSDESKWQSYRLESSNKEYSLYGYVEKGSALDQRIRANLESKSLALRLSLKFPASATTSGQVEIERFVGEGWVEEELP